MSARPPSAGYRLGKFVRRHTVGVAASAIAALALIAFSASTLWQSRQLAAALDTATLEQRKAERVTRFLIDLLAESDPGNALGRDVTVREALDKGAARLRDELGDEPAVRAAVLVQMAEIYRELGSYEHAEALLELATGLLDALPETEADTRVELHQVRANLAHDRGDLDAAAAAYRDTLAAQRALDPLHANVVRTLEDLGVLHIDTGDYAIAIDTLTEAVTTGRRLWPDGDKLLANSLGSLAFANYQAGNNDTAAPLFEEAVAMHRGQSSENTPELAYVLSTYGNFLRAAGRLDEAVTTLREVADIYGDQHGEEHAYHATALINLGSAYNAVGRLEDSVRVARESVRLLEALFDGPHPNKVSAYYQLGAAEQSLGRYAEAETTFRRVLELDRETLGDRHPYVFSDMEQLAVALKHQGKADEAEALMRDVLEGRIDVLGATHPNVAVARLNLSGVLALKGEAEGSVAEAEKAVALLAGEDEANLRLVSARTALAAAFHTAGRYEEAEALYRELLDVHRRTLPEGHPNVARVLHGIGVARLAKGEAAVVALEEALAIREATQGVDHPNTVSTRDALVEARHVARNAR